MYKRQGIKYEADQRHAEIIIQGLGLGEECKAVSTPGKKQDGDDEELGSSQATAYRGFVARANYLAQDRCDIQYAVKELSRSMSKPTKGCWDKLKRLGRYLIGKSRSVQMFPYQSEPNRIHTYTDSDFAGCEQSRKSSSGGVIVLGKSVIKTWSSNQSVIALSSGEAEYYAFVKGASQSIGINNIMKDLGIETVQGIQLLSDASATIGIASRRGSGKVRHIEVNQLWLQDKIMKGIIKVNKIGTGNNIADILTKHVDAETLTKHNKGMGISIVEGRHNLMPAVAVAAQGEHGMGQIEVET